MYYLPHQIIRVKSLHLRFRNKVHNGTFNGKRYWNTLFQMLSRDTILHLEYVNKGDLWYRLPKRNHTRWKDFECVKVSRSIFLWHIWHFIQIQTRSQSMNIYFRLFPNTWSWPFSNLIYVLSICNMCTPWKKSFLYWYCIFMINFGYMEQNVMHKTC